MSDFFASKEALEAAFPGATYLWWRPTCVHVHYGQARLICHKFSDHGYEVSGSVVPPGGNGASVSYYKGDDLTALVDQAFELVREALANRAKAAKGALEFFDTVRSTPT